MQETILHFKCDMCGLCCQHVSLSDIYKHLDRGDGVCRYYEDETQMCSIYDRRPIICNVEVFYEHFMKRIMSKGLFFEMNYRICEKLKNETNS